MTDTRAATRTGVAHQMALRFSPCSRRHDRSSGTPNRSRAHADPAPPPVRRRSLSNSHKSAASSARLAVAVCRDEPAVYRRVHHRAAARALDSRNLFIPMSCRCEAASWPFCHRRRWVTTADAREDLFSACRESIESATRSTLLRRFGRVLPSTFEHGHGLQPPERPVEGAIRRQKACIRRLLDDRGDRIAVELVCAALREDTRGLANRDLQRHKMPRFSAHASLYADICSLSSGATEIATENRVPRPRVELSADARTES